MFKVLIVGSRTFVSSFAEGTRVRVSESPLRPLTEAAILAEALYREKHGDPEGAWEYLERMLKNTTRH